MGWEGNAGICTLNFNGSRRSIGEYFKKELRGSLPKSVPLDFGLGKTFALYFYHQHYYPS